MAENSIGRVSQVIGAVVDVHFEGHLPAILNCSRRTIAARASCSRWRSTSANPRCAASPWTRPRAWCAAIREGHRPADRRPDRSRHARAHHERHRRAGGRGGPDPARNDARHSPACPGLCRAVDGGADPRNRDQGRRSPGALRQGRQGRPLRRRGRRQDGAHPGADQQHRQGPWRLFRVRRRRRAHARGQRPLPRDHRIGRQQEGRRRRLEVRPRLRADERAAGRARPCRPHRPHGRGKLPRPGPGRAALRRQHLPLHAGGLRSLGPARPHPLRGRLPADARDRHGRACRSASPRPRRARSHPCRRSTCRPTT